MLQRAGSTTPHPSSASVCLATRPDQAHRDLAHPQCCVDDTLIGCHLAAQRTAWTSADYLRRIGADHAQDGSSFIHRRNDQHHLLGEVLGENRVQDDVAYLPTAGGGGGAQPASAFDSTGFFGGSGELSSFLGYTMCVSELIARRDRISLSKTSVCGNGQSGTVPARIFTLRSVWLPFDKNKPPVTSFLVSPHLRLTCTQASPRNTLLRAGLFELT